MNFHEHFQIFDFMLFYQFCQFLRFLRYSKLNTWLDLTWFIIIIWRHRPISRSSFWLVQNKHVISRIYSKLIELFNHSMQMATVVRGALEAWAGTCYLWVIICYPSMMIEVTRGHRFWFLVNEYFFLFFSFFVILELNLTEMTDRTEYRTFSHRTYQTL